jgi:hypothetical protein
MHRLIVEKPCTAGLTFVVGESVDDQAIAKAASFRGARKADLATVGTRQAIRYQCFFWTK